MAKSSPQIAGVAGFLLLLDGMIAFYRPEALFVRLGIALGGTAWLWKASGQRAATLGLTFKIHPDALYWFRLAAWLALGMSIVSAGSLTLLWKLGQNPSLLWRFESLEEFWKVWVLQFCIAIPILEELLYRLVLFAGVGSLRLKSLTPQILVAISGVWFILLHGLYGNFSAESAVGGFVLAWAYSRSRSIFVPMALHAAGNLGLGLIHLAATQLG